MKSYKDDIKRYLQADVCAASSIFQKKIAESAVAGGKFRDEREEEGAHSQSEDGSNRGEKSEIHF